MMNCDLILTTLTIGELTDSPMASILLTWKFGGGLEHAGPLRAVSAQLVRRGHAESIELADRSKMPQESGDLSNVTPPPSLRATINTAAKSKACLVAFRHRTENACL